MTAVNGRVMPVFPAGYALAESIVVGFLKPSEKLEEP